MFELHHHWLVIDLYAFIIATYLVFLCRKDHNKRKLTFSIALYITSIAYTGLSLGYINLETQNTAVIWYNLFVLTPFPLLFAIFIAANEPFLKIKNYNNIFNIFLLLSIVTLSFIFLPIKITGFNNSIIWILSVEVLTAVVYQYYKTREIDNLYFLLHIICATIGSISFKLDNEYLAAFAFLLSYVFITFLFIKTNYAH